MRTIAVSFTHAHLLAEMVEGENERNGQIGECKRVASIKVRDKHAGGIWARLGDFNRVESRDYWDNCHHYILGQADSWVMWLEKGEIRVKVT